MESVYGITLPLSAYGITLHLSGDDGDPAWTRKYQAYQHGIAMEVISDQTSRIVFADHARTIVVKVDRGFPQAQREAHAWLNMNPFERSYFATMLEVGENYVVQEYVPLDKSESVCSHGTPTYREARSLCRRNSCESDFHWTQYGIDTRTGLLCIHDYMYDGTPGELHVFSSVRMGVAA